MSDLFKLEENEVIELKFRRHWIVFIFSAFPTILSAFLPLLVLPILVALGIVNADTDPRLVSFGTVFWLLIVWCALAVIWTDYYLDIWYVTDKRIINIDQVGLFDRIVSSWGIERVVEVTVHTANFIQTFLGYGTVQIQTAGPTDEYAHAEGVPHPERVRAAILKHMNDVEILQKKARDQNELLHVVSHEAKGYLSKDAAALAAIVESNPKDVSPDIQALAHRALNETRSGVSAMMGILGGGSISSGAIKTFDASKAAEDAAASFIPSAHQKGIALTLSITSGAAAKGDEMQIRELVFKALIDNAIRYTPTGNIFVSLERSDDAVIFSVKDTGVGMSESDMANLFTDGGHGAHSKEVNAESTGFGLASAKKVVVASGGDITGSSDGPGRGSTFVVRLPIS